MVAEIDSSLSGSKEIASYSGISWQTIEKLIKNDSFPAVKVGGRWISDKSLITEWKKDKIRGKQ